MASEIRVDKINSLSGVGTVTLSPTGVDIAGITTAATLRATTGIVTSLTAGSLTSLGAVSGTTGTFTGDVDIADKIIHTGDTNTAIRFPAADTVTVETGGSERARIDSSGRLLLGTTTASSAGNSQYSKLEVSGNTSGATGPGHLSIKRGTATASLSNGDTIGRLIFSSLDGGDFAYIQASADAAPGSSDYPGRMMFFTAADGASSATERLRIDSSGRIGIQGSPTKGVLDVRASGGSATMLTAVFGANEGTTAGTLSDNTDKACRIGSYHYDIDEEPFGILVASGTNGTNNLTFGGGTSLMNAATEIKFNTAANSTTTAGTNRMTIASDGKIKIGTTATPTQSGAVNVFGTDSGTSQISIRRGSNDDGAPKIHFQKSRNTTDGSHTVVQSNDVLGQIVFAGNDGAGPENGARIGCVVDAAPGGNDMPGRLVFETTPDGSDTLVERMRISAAGAVSIGQYNFDGKYFNVAEPNVTDGHSIYLRANTSSSNSNNRVINCDLHGFYRQSYGQTGFRFRNKDSTSNNRAARVHLYLNDDDSEVGNIMIGTSSSSFNTSSDYRLKENEVLISDGIVRLKQLKPYRFNFKITPSETVDGFFAHEVSPVVPNAVTGEKDAMVPNAWYQEGDAIPSGKSVGDVKGYSSTEMEIQSLDYAKITPLLTAALQEAVTKIEVLETRLNNAGIAT